MNVRFFKTHKELYEQTIRTLQQSVFEIQGKH